MKLPGSALAYTMVLTMVIGALLGSLLAINQHYRKLFHSQYAEDRARDNLRSGMNMILSMSPVTKQSFAMSLFESPLDSFYARTEPWGLFRLVLGKGVFANTIETRACLAGQTLPATTAALFLSGEKQPLTLAGDTHITGDVVSKRSDFIAGKVEGFRYSGNRLVEGRILPFASYPSPIKNECPLNPVFPTLPRPAAGMAVVANLRAVQTWEGDNLEIAESKSVYIDSIYLSGKCKIISGNELIISRRASLNHCLLFARKIIIEDGFSGRIQAFATDSLIVGKNVHLEYPSVIGIKKSTTQPVFLRLDAGSVLEGELIFDGGKLTQPPFSRDHILICQGAIIYGCVKTSHNLDLRGKVNGIVATGNFLLNTPGTVYENYLFGAEINPAELSPEFAGIITDSTRWLQIIEWL
ncbi:MAG: hypothetical protein R3C61_00870 [Bacteroidia bacterium]